MRRETLVIRFYALILSCHTVTTLMFSLNYATTFSEGFYRAEDGCARGYDGPQLRQESADSEVLNCRYQAIAPITHPPARKLHSDDPTSLRP
jgi:hypothetical protein